MSNGEARPMVFLLQKRYQNIMGLNLPQFLIEQPLRSVNKQIALSQKKNEFLTSAEELMKFPSVHPITKLKEVITVHFMENRIEV